MIEPTQAFLSNTQSLFSLLNCPIYSSSPRHEPTRYHPYYVLNHPDLDTAMSLQTLSKSEKNLIGKYSDWGMEEGKIARSLGVPQSMVAKQMEHFKAGHWDCRGGHGGGCGKTAETVKKGVEG